MNVPVNSHSIDIPTEFQSCFDKQRAAYLAAPEPSYAQRIADLRSLTRLLKDNKDDLVAAINADYGNRSEFETLFAEYFVVLETVADAVKHLKKWMKPQRRHVDFMTYPLARNRVIPQPLGVVGVIVPWNFPLNLSFCPLAAILAADTGPEREVQHFAGGDGGVRADLQADGHAGGDCEPGEATAWGWQQSH